MNETQRKKWRDDWNRQLDIAVRGEVGAIRRFYIEQYDKGIADFLGNNQSRNFFNIFKFVDFVDIYVQLYRRVGLRFAKWAFTELEGRETKAVSMDDRLAIWEDTFVASGYKIGRSKIVIVQGTALRTLETELTRLMRDPEFMAMGNEQRGRILRQRFNKISQYQAERISRTECAIAAQDATRTASFDFYGGPENCDKVWNHAGTREPRSAHIALDGLRIPATQKFNVNGFYTNEPRGPELPVGEIANCGCSATYVRKEPKQGIDPAFAAALATLLINDDDE